MSETNKKLTKNIIAGKLSPDAEDKIIPIQKVEFKDLSEALPCGFPIDDMFLGGFREGQLIIISGLSGQGKTTLSLQITKNYSEQGIPLVWFSYEMPLNELQWKFKQMGGYEDLLCYVPRKNVSDNIQWLGDKIVEAISIYYTKIVFIDNLDFLTIDKQEGDDKLTTQKRIVGMLKKIAINYEVIIFLNAHVHRLEAGKEPRMQNLYGASEVYKLSDAIIFIHRLREKVGRGEQALKFTNESKIIVDKNRLNGKVGSFKMIMKNNKFNLIDNIHEDETN